MTPTARKVTSGQLHHGWRFSRALGQFACSTISEENDEVREVYVEPATLDRILWNSNPPTPIPPKSRIKPLFDLHEGRGDFPFILSKIMVTRVPRLHIIKPNCVTQSCVNCRLQSNISVYRLPILFTGSQQVNKIIDTNHHCSI